MKYFSFLFAALLLTALCLPAAAQKFQPKTIQFQGDPEYTDSELMAAVGLKNGAVLSQEQMQKISLELSKSGIFEQVIYKFDGVDLVFSLTQATALFPIRIDNLPLTAGAGLDAKLRAKFPLYHGKVPSEGTLLEGVRTTLEEMLAAEGLNATVAAVPYGKPGTSHLTAMNFTIVSPPVQIGDLKLQGVSDAMATKVKELAAHQVATPYFTDSADRNLTHAFESLYTDEGYAAVHVQAAQSGPPIVTPNAIQIPYLIQVDEGKRYKLAGVHLPANSLVLQAEIDKSLSTVFGGTVQGTTLRSSWYLISTRYKSKGYLDCEITPHPVLDEAAGTVSYNVEINPGPVYHLAFVKFDNVSDELRSRLMRYWQMLPGDTFDDSYPFNFISAAANADPAIRQAVKEMKVSFKIMADPQTHDVNCVIVFSKP